MRWISHEHPAGAAVWRGLTLTLASGVVVLLSAATVRAARRGQFFTRRGSSLPTGPGGGGVRLWGGHPFSYSRSENNVGIRAWFRRSNRDEGETARERVKGQSTTKRRAKPKDRHPRPPRREQYDSEFITRYGDPFD